MTKKTIGFYFLLCLCAGGWLYYWVYGPWQRLQQTHAELQRLAQLPVRQASPSAVALPSTAPPWALPDIMQQLLQGLARYGCSVQQMTPGNVLRIHGIALLPVQLQGTVSLAQLPYLSQGLAALPWAAAIRNFSLHCTAERCTFTLTLWIWHVPAMAASNMANTALPTVSPRVAGYLYSGTEFWEIERRPNGSLQLQKKQKPRELPPVNDKSLALDLTQANLADAITLLAQFNHLNVTLSPTIAGSVTVHYANLMRSEAFAALLTAYGLVQWTEHQSLRIASQAEFLKLQQDSKQYTELTAAATPMGHRVWQIHYAKAEEVARLIEDNTHTLLSPRGLLRVDRRTNRVSIYDIPTKLTEMAQLIASVDIPVQQVLIEAHLASIDSDYLRALGIQFAVNANAGMPADANTAVAEDLSDGFTIARLGVGSQLSVKLAALERLGHAELISSPSLFTANLQTASIEAGEEIPYQEVSRSGGTAVTFKKAVLSLKVTPHILPGRRVLLDLQVHQDQPSAHEVLGVPAIDTRQINTQILLRDEQTVVLGGIYETNNGQNTERVPFLSKIPLVGLLFQQQNVINRKRELVIFVKPKIIQQG